MTSKSTTQGWQPSIAWSAFQRASRLFVFGFLGWLWFVSSDRSAWRSVALVAIVALATLVGITWYLAASRAERRWRAAIDRYTEKEAAKRDSPVK